jgi:hypothetical protein
MMDYDPRSMVYRIAVQNKELKLHMMLEEMALEFFAHSRPDSIPIEVGVQHMGRDITIQGISYNYRPIDARPTMMSMSDAIDTNSIESRPCLFKLSEAFEVEKELVEVEKIVEVEKKIFVPKDYNTVQEHLDAVIELQIPRQKKLRKRKVLPIIEQSNVVQLRRV